MAKSKSGGTRTYIRGRVGSDVYSIGRDAKGKKQQVVRSLAESVANPQTQAQMKGRMIMSTIAQALAVLRPIVDHSFDGLPAGQPNLSRFISLNYELLKADVAAHFSSGNTFALNKYQEKGAKAGRYKVSEGSVFVSDYWTVDTANACPYVKITIGANSPTVQTLLDNTGLNLGDYFTVFGVDTDGKLQFIRAYIKSDLNPATAITSDNVASLFQFESSEQVTVRIATGQIEIFLATEVTCSALILSKKEGSAWKHSASTMVTMEDSLSQTAAIALPTYPQGSSRFLNGGDI